MKRSRLSYDEWKCIENKQIQGRNVITDFFQGYIELIKIEQVTEPQIWRFNGEDIVVCDRGLKWLSILPEKEYYCITAMLNKRNEILLWYIDMIADKGIDIDGIPYFDDLYLDLVVYPDGSIVEDDRDELEEALLSKDITQEQFDLALETSQKLQKGLLSDVSLFAEYTKKCYEILDGHTMRENSMIPTKG